jgi:ATP-dependent DNA helicase RecQ
VFDKLRALRTELARELRMPPYIVFHDSTLRALARELPHDESSFLAVKGAGPGRWQRFGERVLAITGAARPPMPPVPEPDSAPMVREPPPWVEQMPLPTMETDDLWSMCASGATLPEICTRLRRTSAEVASRIADGTRQGRRVDVARLLGPERLEAIRSAAAGANGDVVAVRKRLPFPVALAEIRLALTAQAS